MRFEQQRNRKIRHFYKFVEKDIYNFPLLIFKNFLYDTNFLKVEYFTQISMFFQWFLGTGKCTIQRRWNLHGKIYRKCRIVRSIKNIIHYNTWYTIGKITKISTLIFFHRFSLFTSHYHFWRYMKLNFSILEIYKRRGKSLPFLNIT